MAATITVDKRAYAFRSGEKIIYVLFESSYEKNVIPHQSRWCCIAIGDIAQVLRRIYGSVHATVGGCLQGRNGWISPTNYLRAWMAELANPCVMPDRAIELKYGSSFYDTLQKEADNMCDIKSADQVRSALLSKGVNVAPIDLAIAHAEKNERLYIGLYEYADFVVALAQNGVLPWRLISSMVPYTERDSSLGYQPEKPKAYVMNHRYVRLLTNPRYLDGSLLMRTDVRTPGVWVQAGDYKSNWLSTLAVAEEMEKPGSVLKGLRTQLTAQKDALFASLDTVVTVSRPGGDDNRWFRESFANLAEKLGQSVSDAWAPLTVIATLKACLEAGALDEIGYLADYISHVEIDDTKLVTANDMRQQIDLLKTAA